MGNSHKPPTFATLHARQALRPVLQTPSKNTGAPFKQTANNAPPRPMVKQPVAPPVYRPQPSPKSVQAKAAGVAPPFPARHTDAARPAHAAGQLKTPLSATQRRAGQTTPAAPPVYRPQTTPKVLQPKTGATPLRPLTPPPVYRPVQKKVVQPQMKATPAAQHSPTPTAPPVYRPQPTPHVLQRKAAPAASPKRLVKQPRPPVHAAGKRGNAVVQRYLVHNGFQWVENNQPPIGVIPYQGKWMTPQQYSAALYQQQQYQYQQQQQYAATLYQQKLYQNQQQQYQMSLMSAQPQQAQQVNIINHVAPQTTTYTPQPQQVTPQITQQIGQQVTPQVAPQQPVTQQVTPQITQQTTPQVTPQQPASQQTTAPVKYKPQRTKLSKPGKSTHFPGKLPQRPTREDTLKKFPAVGNEKAKFDKIYKGSERSGLPDKVTKRLRDRGRDDVSNKRQMTQQARDMSASNDPSLSDAAAERNHIFPSESSLVAFSGGMSVLTTKGTSQTDRVKKKQAMKDVAKVLTGNDPSVMKHISKKIDDVDSDYDSDDAISLVNELAKETADHHYNIDLGHPGRNKSMSNRLDVCTSPGRTSINERDYNIAHGLEQPLKDLLGNDLCDDLLYVPMSPGGTHIFSSKTSL